nr:hypothetical protein [Burkholderia thailandensis]
MSTFTAGGDIRRSPAAVDDLRRVSVADWIASARPSTRLGSPLSRHAERRAIGKLQLVRDVAERLAVSLTKRICSSNSASGAGTGSGGSETSAPPARKRMRARLHENCPGSRP